MSTPLPDRKPRKRDKIKNFLRKVISGRSRHASSLPVPPNRLQDNRNTPMEDDPNLNRGSSTPAADVPLVVRSEDSRVSVDENLELSGTPAEIVASANLAWHGFQLVSKKLESLLDGTPFKVPVALFNRLIDLGNAVMDNTDNMHDLVTRTRDRLEMIDTALLKTRDDDVAEERILRFAAIVIEQVVELTRMTNRPLGIRILDSDEDKKKVKASFQRLEECTKDFHLDIALSIERKTTAVFQSLEKLHLASWPRSRQAVYNADLDSTILTRTPCTPGTRVAIIDTIIDWARSSTSAPVFWLSGMAGTGKSTIAYSTCQRVESTGQDSRDVSLAASFFCSRQIEDARRRKYIVPSIVYQLTRRSRSYAERVLNADFDAVDVSSRQMKELLVEPWEKSRPDRPSILPNRLIVVDALDENDGGSDFLKELLDTVGQGHLRGLKFLVTSRPDPKIVAFCEGFPPDAVCHLHEVRREDVRSDILTFLRATLPALCDKPQLQELVLQTGGLFIYAATAVRFISPQKYAPREQEKQLKTLLGAWPARTDSVKALLVDQLYSQVLRSTFFDVGETILQPRVAILHTILCAEEPISVSVVNALLIDLTVDEDMVKHVVEDLHAVLYVSKRDGCIYWYHKSFYDFMFDSRRLDMNGFSADLTCKRSSHHAILAHACFHVMQDLRFNICDLPSSFLLDAEVLDLETRIHDNITPPLRYASRQWAHHVVQADPTQDRLYHDIEKFCKTKLLFWIEVMNLIGAKTDCYASLRSLKEWVQKRQENIGLAKYMADAAMLAAKFAGSPASLSTPHLYLSTFAAYNEESMLRQNWSKKFSGIPSLLFTNGTNISSPLFMTVPTESIILGVAISCDGSRIASASWDETAHVWEAETGTKIATLKGHTQRVYSVAFSPDGLSVASSSDDRTVRLWDTNTGTEIMCLLGHTDSISSIVFSPNGSRIISGSWDETVRIWDVEAGTEIASLKGHTDSVASVAVSSDGTRIASASWDRTVRVWGSETGLEILVLSDHADSVSAVTFSPDCSRIVSASHDHIIHIWDAEDGTELMTLNNHTDPVSSVAFSPDSSRIVTGSWDKTVRVWDVETGTELAILTGHTRWVMSVAFSPDGSRIISGSYDQTVRVWDAEAVPETTALNGHVKPVYSTAFSPDGSRIVSGSEDKTVRLWDAKTGTEIAALHGHTRWTMSVVFSPGGSRVLSASGDKTLRVWDADAGTELTILNGHTKAINSAVFSPDGSHIVSGSYDKTVRVWHVQQRIEHAVLNGHTASVFSVSFSPNSSRIASGSGDNTVRVWDADTGRELIILNGHTELVSAVAFSPNGLHVVSGSVDKTLRVWDIVARAELFTLRGHTESVTSVAFSPKGYQIVSGSGDKTVRLWDVGTGTEIAVLKGHTDLIYSVSFSPDGCGVVSGSRDSTVRVWDTRSLGHHLANSSMIASSWTLDKNGWIVIPRADSVGVVKAMWLPSLFRDILYHPLTSLIISSKGSVRVNLASSYLGAEWSRCYISI